MDIEDLKDNIQQALETDELLLRQSGPRQVSFNNFQKGRISVLNWVLSEIGMASESTEECPECGCTDFDEFNDAHRQCFECGQEYWGE